MALRQRNTTTGCWQTDLQPNHDVSPSSAKRQQPMEYSQKREGTLSVRSHADDWLRHLANINKARTKHPQSRKRLHSSRIRILRFFFQNSKKRVFLRFLK